MISICVCVYGSVSIISFGRVNVKFHTPYVEEFGIYTEGVCKAQSLSLAIHIMETQSRLCIHILQDSCLHDKNQEHIQTYYTKLRSIVFLMLRCVYGPMSSCLDVGGPPYGEDHYSFILFYM